MKFDIFDTQMREYETGTDVYIPKTSYAVVRLDGRNFTRLTKQTHDFIRPFDERMLNHMIATTRHLMECGFKIVYGYTQSDEISLLLHPADNSFSRKERKILSVLAGEASAKFTDCLGDVGVFDARISQLPDKKRVIDYFRWRNEDARRNALHAHCYWLLRNQGEDAANAESVLSGKSMKQKQQFLKSHEIDFGAFPGWQRKGYGFVWETYAKQGVNPITQELCMANRTRLKTDLNLPEQDGYDEYLDQQIPEISDYI